MSRYHWMDEIKYMKPIVSNKTKISDVRPLCFNNGTNRSSFKPGSHVIGLLCDVEILLFHSLFHAGDI